MNVAVIDADLIGRKNHRFPNLASMKISGYHKEVGDSVILKTDYKNLDSFDRVYISKAFTDTTVDENVLNLPNVECGGTGFFYDKAEPLPYEIEHHMPDYHLYDSYVNECLSGGYKRNQFEYYLDYSIGYLTRGCFRKCSFCVNQNYNRVIEHSPLKEFYDPSRKKICLLDDNFLGYHDWKRLLNDLRNTGKRFQFRQGLDERLLNDEKCSLLFSSMYDKDFVFAFDNIEDREIIEDKMKLIREYSKKQVMFYVLCGYDRSGKYDMDFWRKDIKDLLERIYIIGRNSMHPYIMRFEKYKESPYKGMYINLARFCNQLQIFKKMTLNEFVEQDAKTGAKKSLEYLRKFKDDFPELADEYCDKHLYVK